MINFGFSIAPSSTINLDKVDQTKFDRLHEAEQDVAKCMACGSCSSTCPAGRFSGMSVRKVILALQRGREKDAVKMLKGCMLCGKCSMVCPRGINTRHLILSICRIYNDELK